MAEKLKRFKAVLPTTAKDMSRQHCMTLAFIACRYYYCRFDTERYSVYIASLQRKHFSIFAAHHVQIATTEDYCQSYSSSCVAYYTKSCTAKIATCASHRIARRIIITGTIYLLLQFRTKFNKCHLPMH